jgi:hypothetical protein
MADEREDPGLDVLPASDEEIEAWSFFDDTEPHSLVDLVNRVLDKGVCITGEVTISVAGVDLVYLGLNAILTSIATARRRIDPTVGPDRGPAGSSLGEGRPSGG